MTGPAGKLRVVHCAGFYFPDSTGGAEVYVRDLVTALARHSIDSTIIAATDGAYDRYSWHGVDVVRYRIAATDSVPAPQGEAQSRRTAFQDIVVEVEADLFHLHSWTSGTGLQRLRQVARLGIPSVVTMHVPSPQTCRHATGRSSENNGMANQLARDDSRSGHIRRRRSVPTVPPKSAEERQKSRLALLGKVQWNQASKPCHTPKSAKFA